MTSVEEAAMAMGQRSLRKRSSAGVPAALVMAAIMLGLPPTATAQDQSTQVMRLASDENAGSASVAYDFVVNVSPDRSIVKVETRRGKVLAEPAFSSLASRITCVD